MENIFYKETEQVQAIAKLPRSIFAVFSAMSIFVFIVFFMLAYNSTNQALFTAFVFIAPSIPFVSLLSLMIYRYYHELLDEKAYIAAEFVFVGGIVSVLFSLILNSDFYLLILALALIFQITQADIQFLLFLMFAVLAPIVEETAKMLPIFILSRSIVKEWGQRETRVFKGQGLVVFCGILIGLIFTFLETYLYVFRFDPLNTNNSQSMVYLQVLIRWLFPIHVTTTTLMALGIYLSLSGSNKTVLPLKDYQTFFATYIVAILIHGAWNGSLVLGTQNTPDVKIFGESIYLTTLAVGIISNIILLLVVLKFVNIQVPQCNFCMNYHEEPHTAETHLQYRLAPKHKIEINPDVSKFSFRYLKHRFQQRNIYRQRQELLQDAVKRKDYPLAEQYIMSECQLCFSFLDTDGICRACNSVPLNVCTNCNFPVPVYSTECWKCSQTIIPPFESTLSYPNKLSNSIAIGIAKFTGVSFIGAVILVALLIFMNEWEGLVNFGIVFLFMLMALAVGIALYWNSSLRTKGYGLGILRILAGIVLFDLGIFGVTWAILGMFLTVLFSIDILAVVLAAIYTITVFIGFVYIGTRMVLDTKIVVHR